MLAETFLVLTVIGDDRPGLVGELSATISAHQGNWLESSMSHLAGKFAGIVRVAVPNAQAEPLKAALATLGGLKITAETSQEQKSVSAGRRAGPAELYAAVVEGAVERVRPKMMTVVAIMAGLLPIMWGTGTGSEVMRRIAAPMVGGMISSTILTLIVIPAIYALVKERRLG